MIEISLWRARIGQFAHSHDCTTSLRLVLPHQDGGHSRPCLVPVCVLVIAAVLLMGGDIERNPGPNGNKGASELPSLFRSHYYQLCNSLSSQHTVITPLADILYGLGLVSDETRLAVQHTVGLPPYDRATRLLDPAVKVARDSVEEAQKFCKCLQECGIPVSEEILEGIASAITSSAALTPPVPVLMPGTPVPQGTHATTSSASMSSVPVLPPGNVPDGILDSRAQVQRLGMPSAIRDNHSAQVQTLIKDKEELAFENSQLKMLLQKLTTVTPSKGPVQAQPLAIASATSAATPPSLVATTNTSSAPETRYLDEDDLYMIVSELHDVTDVLTLGLALGIRKSALDKIMQGNTNLEGQKIQVIHYWLTRTDIVRQKQGECPEWKSLADAVASINCALSFRIQQKHC